MSQSKAGISACTLFTYTCLRAKSSQEDLKSLRPEFNLHCQKEVLPTSQSQGTTSSQAWAARQQEGPEGESQRPSIYNQ